MSAAVLDRSSLLGGLLGSQPHVVEPWLRAAAAAGARADDVRAALAELEPLTPRVAEPLVDRPGPGSAAVLEAVRLTVDLVARGRWVPGHPQRAAVLHVLPALAPWCRARGRAVVAPLVSAAAVVGRAGALDRWTALLAAAPPPAAGDVRTALLVAAWRCGLVRYREAALDAAAALAPEVARPLLALPPDADVAAVVARHRADRWWWPGAPAAPGVVTRVGGFLPLGGPWVGLPRAVAGGPSGWLALADGRRWAVVADAHGATVVALDRGPGDAAGERGPATAPPPGSPPALPVPWTDTVTGLVPAPDGHVVLVSRAHSYALDVVRLDASPAAA